MNQLTALPEELTIYSVGSLRNELAQGLDSTAGDEAFGLDCGCVSEVDGAGLQLLISLALECRARRRDLLLQGPSRVLTDALGALGLSSFFVQASGAAL